MDKNMIETNTGSTFSINLKYILDRSTNIKNKI